MVFSVVADKIVETAMNANIDNSFLKVVNFKIQNANIYDKRDKLKKNQFVPLL